MCLTLDIDLEACQTGCQTGILSFFTDCKRQLIIRNNNQCSLLIWICQYGDHLCRAQCILNQQCRILIPADDIDLLTTQFFHNKMCIRDRQKAEPI